MSNEKRKTDGQIVEFVTWNCVYEIRNVQKIR